MNTLFQPPHWRIARQRVFRRRYQCINVHIIPKGTRCILRGLNREDAQISLRLARHLVTFTFPRGDFMRNTRPASPP